MKNLDQVIEQLSNDYFKLELIVESSISENNQNSIKEIVANVKNSLNDNIGYLMEIKKDYDIAKNNMEFISSCDEDTIIH